MRPRVSTEEGRPVAPRGGPTRGPAPDPRRPRTHGGGLTDPRGLQGVDRSVREARWGLRARGGEDEPPLHRGEHGPRPRRVRGRGRSAGRRGPHYEPWSRFHPPVHYYYDLLVGLELVTALGRGADPRLEHALSVLKRKRRADGRWNLDAVHPDLEGKMADWYAAHPKHRPTPFALEAPGEPSKIITLRADLVPARP